MPAAVGLEKKPAFGVFGAVMAIFTKSGIIILKRCVT
jgi:hypothetical protein